jgi:adenylate cyclase
VEDEQRERRLAAILSADAVDYTRLMNEDDEATVETVEAHRACIASLIERFRGRLVDAPGDNLLAEFPSAVGSVRCAIEVQHALARENEALAADRRMPFRIGIHLGDVLVEGERIYGDGVNIAARLEGLAEPNGICVSDVVHQQVRRRLELATSDLGAQQLKGIESPVHTHRIHLDEAAAPTDIPRTVNRSELAPPEKPSLAVLPFVNMSGDATEDHFGDGLTANIMTELSRLPGLFLIGQDSMFTYKSTGAKPREVARELGVRHVLEGTVRRAGPRVRVTARLVEAATGRTTWAERYDRQVEDLFDVEDDITDQVVTALDVELVGGEGARTLRQHLRSPQAIGLLYRAAELMHRFTKADMTEARSLHEEIMRIEPESPFAYADAAWTHYFDVERRWSDDPEESLDKMSVLARHALELGDVSGYPSIMLAHMHLMRREYDEALATSTRAVQERPSCQAAFGLNANILNYLGRPLEAVPLAEQTIRLSPVAQPWFPEVLATAHYLSGSFEDAISTANYALSLAPDSVDARLVLAASLVETGRIEAAREAAQEILEIDPAFTLKQFADSQPYREPAVLKQLIDTLRKAGLRWGDGDTPLRAHVVQPHSATRRRVAPRPIRH